MMPIFSPKYIFLVFCHRRQGTPRGMLLDLMHAFLFTGVTIHPLSTGRDTTIFTRSLKTVSFTSTPCQAIASAFYLALASPTRRRSDFALNLQVGPVPFGTLIVLLRNA